MADYTSQCTDQISETSKHMFYNGHWALFWFDSHKNQKESKVETSS